MAIKNQTIVIVGAGEVGFHAAEVLLHESYNITLIDSSRERLDEVEEILDVQTLHGFGVDPEVLRRAQTQDADLFLAVSDNDETNILAAWLAKQMGARAVVARARNPMYSDSAAPFRRRMNIDMVVCPEMLAAFELAKYVDNPDVLAFQHFAMGRVEMQRISLTEHSFVIRQPLEDLKLPGMLVALIRRGDDLIAPSGKDMLLPGDVATVIGESEQMNLLQSIFHFPEEGVQRVLIAGGGMTGQILAQTLEARRFSVALIERDRKRAEQLAEALAKTEVIHGDATRRAFMKEERIDEADIFLATMGEDEDNVMACLLARDLGARKVGAVIHRPDYADVLEKIGVNTAVSPRHLAASRIVALVRRGGAQSVAVLEGGAAEILELRVRPDCAIAGRPLREVDFPPGALLALVARREKVFVPKGDDALEPGDMVVAFSLAKSIDRLERLFD